MWHIYQGEKHVFDAPTWSCAVNLFNFARTWYCTQVWLCDDEKNILISKRGTGQYKF